MPETEQHGGAESLLSKCLAGVAPPDEGWRLRLFHGTTHRFEAFGAIPDADPTGAFGPVHYFSTSRADVRRNYTGDGADLAHRIDQAAASGGLSRAEAAARLHGGCPGILTVQLTTRSPFFVDARDLLAQESRFDPMNGGLATPGDETPPEGRSPRLFPELPGLLDADRSRILSEAGHDEASLARAAPAERDRIEDAAFLSLEEIRERHLGSIEDAFGHAMAHLGLDETRVPSLPQGIVERLDEIDHGGFYAALLGSEEVQDLALEDGRQVGGAFAGRVVSEMGFDAIVMMQADRRWKDFDMDPGTAHVHVAEENARNIEITRIERGPEAAGLRPPETGDREARVAARARDMHARRAAARPRRAALDAR